MLTLNALVRFALSRSPFREQREILFANTNPNPPTPHNEQHGEPEKPEAFRTQDEEHLVERETRDTGAQISSVLRALDSQEVFDRLSDELKNGETFDRLFTHEESMGAIDLSSIATRSGIAIYMSERESVLPQGTPRKVLSAILDFDMKEGLPIQVKRTFIELLLRESPGITAAFARSTIARIASYEEQQAAIETARKRFDEEELLGKIGAEGMAAASRLSLGQIPDSRTAVNEIGAKHPLSTDQLQEIHTALDNVSAAMRRAREFGNRYWGSTDTLSPEQDEKRKLEYLRHLKEQARDLSRLLSIQLRLGAQETVQSLEEGAAAALKQPQAKGHEGEIQKRAADPGMRALKLIASIDDPKSDLVQDAGNPNFTRLMDTFLQESELHLSLFNSIRKDADRLLKRWKSQEGFKDETHDAQERQTWAGQRLTQITAVLADSELSAPTRHAIERLQQQVQNPETAATFDDEEMARQEYMLQTLVERGEGYILRANQESDRQTVLVKQELASTELDAWASGKKQELAGYQDTIKSLTGHPVCAALGIPGQVDSYAADLMEQLDLVRQQDLQAMCKEDLCIRIGSQIGHFRTAADLLRKMEEALGGDIPQEGNDFVVVLSPDAFFEKFRVRNANGCFDKGKIWIRSDIEGEKRRSVIQHEKAHVILSILSDQSYLFPDLLEKTYEDLDDATWQTLEARGKDWGITREAIRARYQREHPGVPEELLRQRVEARYRRSLLEEAAVSGALAAEGTRDREIFDRLSRQRRGEHDGAPVGEMSTPLFSTDNDGAPAAEEDENPSEGNANPNAAYDAKEDLEEIERMLMNIDSFGDAYGVDRKRAGQNFNPAFRSQADEILGKGRDGGFRDVFDALSHIYRKGKERDSNRPVDPALDVTYRDTVIRFKDHVGKTANTVKELDQKFSEGIEAAAPEGKKSISQRLGIQWLCALDLVRMYKEFKEDIEGMWRSMQDHTTAEAKAALTQKLPVYIPGTKIKIPIIGKYTERLPHYTERARNSKELERVKKWEDAFTNLDADELLHLIGSTPTKDQLRASIELLVKKGRMAWGDERVWKALNEKSIYKMPYGPCQHSEIIRDKWLHKLITQIWRDKDMFNEWMTKNQSNYDSHKKEYTHEADNFSNISGQMSHELRSMLKTYVECTTAKPKKPLPEQVNPHHYEELLHYAMRNGKMSMEQKMFYLIQGIASGFMSIDRLRVLSGERGELLSRFPFLDYFYQRHNTLKEIKNLAGRLREKDDPYKPGVKTTLFMRLIVLRDQKVRERMTKASDRKAEEIDHEDVPYLATDIDYVKMQNLLGNISGERWKVTVQGWKNAYVGFNEKFKTYAHLARMAREGKARFSPHDISDLAQTVASYVVMDNKLTGAAAVAKEAQLSKQNFDSEGPVANPSVTTSTFRNRTRDFVGDLVRSVGMTDSDLQTGLTLDQFLASRDRDQTQIFDDAFKKKMIATIDPFAKAIIAKIEENPNVIIEKLISWEGGSFAGGRKFLDGATESNGASPITTAAVDREYPALVGN